MKLENGTKEQIAFLFIAFCLSSLGFADDLSGNYIEIATNQRSNK